MLYCCVLRGNFNSKGKGEDILIEQEGEEKTKWSTWTACFFWGGWELGLSLDLAVKVRHADNE